MLFMQSMAIGLFIAVPVGPIGMLCIQRSLNRGFRAGFATGMGAACADAVYGLLGALGVAGVVTALPTLGVALKIGGGLFLLWLAWGIAREAPPARDVSRALPKTSAARDFLTTFGLTLSNPMTILSFVGVFAALGPMTDSQEGLGGAAVLAMVGGVLVGSAAWWLCLSTATATVRKAIPDAWLRRFSGISALVVAVFGAAQIYSGVASLLE